MKRSASAVTARWQAALISNDRACDAFDSRKLFSGYRSSNLSTGEKSPCEQSLNQNMNFIVAADEVMLMM
jgi:hypothetical protein